MRRDPHDRFVFCAAVTWAGCIFLPLTGAGHVGYAANTALECPGTNKPYVVNGQRYMPLSPVEVYVEEGTASWFGDEVIGKKTACGQNADSESMTAAHTTLPLPSRTRVTNLENGMSVVLWVTDRGPFASNRIISVSEMAARALGFRDQRTAHVRVERLDISGPVASAGPRRTADEVVYLETEIIFGANKAAIEANELFKIAGVNAEILEFAREDAYRIRIGPFQSRREAGRARARIIIERQQDLHIVVE